MKQLIKQFRKHLKVFETALKAGQTRLRAQCHVATWNPGDLCSCKPEISKQPVDIFEKDTRVGTGFQGWFCSIVGIFLANFWRGSSLSGFRYELEDTIQVLGGTFFTHPPKWVFNRTSPKKVGEIGKLSPDFSSFQCGNIQLFPFRPINLISLSTDFEQNYPKVFIWGWIFILPASGGRLWLMPVLETSRYRALERMCLSLFYRFVCEGTLNLQVCKLKISESVFNRCILFFHDTNPGFQFEIIASSNPSSVDVHRISTKFLCAIQGSKIRAAVIGPTNV